MAEEIRRLQLMNEELSSLIRQDETWERRQKAMHAMSAQLDRRGGDSAILIVDIDEFEAADAEWRAAVEEADRIVGDIRAGRR